MDTTEIESRWESDVGLSLRDRQKATASARFAFRKKGVARLDRNVQIEVADKLGIGLNLSVFVESLELKSLYPIQFARLRRSVG